MINERFVNHVIVLLCTLVFLFACCHVKGQSLHIVSGTVEPERVTLLHDLPTGDYFLAIRYIDGHFYSVPFSVENTGKMQRKEFDNIDRTCKQFAIAILMNDDGEIIWRGKLGSDHDSD